MQWGPTRSEMPEDSDLSYSTKSDMGQSSMTWMQLRYRQRGSIFSLDSVPGEGTNLQKARSIGRARALRDSNHADTFRPGVK